MYIMFLKTKWKKKKLKRFKKHSLLFNLILVFIDGQEHLTNLLNSYCCQAMYVCKEVVILFLSNNDSRLIVFLNVEEYRFFLFEIQV